MTDGPPRYSLALSDDEVARYRVMAEMAHATEARQWERAGITAGARIVDLGCGPGLFALELASIVGAAGAVVAVDREPSAIETARKLVEEAAVANVRVVDGPAWESGLEPGSFDVVNIRHVLAHNTAADQRRILRHAFDLLAPGGSLYVLDVDLSTGRTDPPDPDVRDLFDRYIAHLAGTGRDPAIGPVLGSLVVECGFELVERDATVAVPPPASLRVIRPPAWAARDAMVESGHATPADVERWDRALRAFQAHPHPAFFMTMFSATARKP